MKLKHTAIELMAYEEMSDGQLNKLKPSWRDQGKRAELLMADGRLNGRTVKVFIDPGAQGSFVSEQLVRYMHLKTDQEIHGNDPRG